MPRSQTGINGDRKTMKRRTYLKTVLAAATGTAVGNAAPAHPIVLDVDLVVDPAKEKEMLHNFETVFKPAAVKYPGYIDVKILKLRSALQGSAPAGMNYRFSLTYQSEEMRQKWIHSDIHQRVWPTVENTLLNKNYTVLLFDVT
jgi:antibiotic biosynthesis monooxygenase (ABM) superfamily enzyme